MLAYVKSLSNVFVKEGVFSVCTLHQLRSFLLQESLQHRGVCSWGFFRYHYELFIIIYFVFFN